MPFGMRYIAMQMKEAFKAKFPGNDDEVIKILGNLMYYRYMNPAIVAPEAFDVIESNITPIQRKNLAEVAKTLHQISVSRISPSEDPHQAKMNEYIGDAAKRFAIFLKEVSTVPTSEEYFNIDEFVDLGRMQKPTNNTNDPLRVILSDLGACPPAIEGKDVPGNEVTLSLTNRFAKLDDKNVRLKHIFMETKRFVLTIVRVQSGNSLLSVLEAPVTEREEQIWADLHKKELLRHQEKRTLVHDTGLTGSKDFMNSRDTLNSNPLSIVAATGFAIGSNANLLKDSDGQ
ncbi:hypothetical protein HK096_010080, partial [Nowakowskiella sp. JEL0078]